MKRGDERSRGRKNKKSGRITEDKWMDGEPGSDHMSGVRSCVQSTVRGPCTVPCIKSGTVGQRGNIRDGYWRRALSGVPLASNLSYEFAATGDRLGGRFALSTCCWWIRADPQWSSCFAKVAWSCRRAYHPHRPMEVVVRLLAPARAPRSLAQPNTKLQIHTPLFPSEGGIVSPVLPHWQGKTQVLPILLRLIKFLRSDYHAHELDSGVPMQCAER